MKLRDNDKSYMRKKERKKHKRSLYVTWREKKQEQFKQKAN